MEIIMPTFQHDHHRNPKLFIHNALFFGIGTLPYSYHKLPKKLLNLSVLKLDGSSFGIQVSINATVAELKLALEEFFNLLPKEERCTVSWSHVWGHFCLCYEGQKLLDDKAYIRRFGIKDGDQIEFVRHVTIDYRPTRQQIKNQSDELRQCSMSSANEDGQASEGSKSDFVKDQETSIDEYEEDTVFIPGSKLVNFFRGRFSYRNLRNGIV